MQPRFDFSSFLSFFSSFLVCLLCAAGSFSRICFDFRRWIWNAQYQDDMKLLYTSASVARVANRVWVNERKKKCFNFNLSYIIYSQFETFDALLIDKIQDIDKYVGAHFGCTECEIIVFNERALHRNQCLWCSAKGWKRRSTEEREIKWNVLKWEKVLLEIAKCQFDYRECVCLWVCLDFFMWFLFSLLVDFVVAVVIFWWWYALNVNEVRAHNISICIPMESKQTKRAATEDDDEEEEKICWLNDICSTWLSCMKYKLTVFGSRSFSSSKIKGANPSSGLQHEIKPLDTRNAGSLLSLLNFRHLLLAMVSL